MSTSCDVALRQMPQKTIDDKSTLVQEMVGAVRQQAMTWTIADPNLSHHYDTTKPQWVNISRHVDIP